MISSRQSRLYPEEERGDGKVEKGKGRREKELPFILERRFERLDLRLIDEIIESMPNIMIQSQLYEGKEGPQGKERENSS